MSKTQACGAARGPRGVRGFSAVELLVTTATVGVLAAMAIPSLDAMIARNRLAAAHNEFLTSIYQVRSEAAKRNRVVRMCRIRDVAAPSCDTSEGGGWHTGWAIWVDTDSSGDIDGIESAISVHGPFRGGVVLTGSGTTAVRVAFRSTGATWGAGNGTFTVCSPGSPIKRQIILSRPGRVRTREIDSDGEC